MKLAEGATGATRSKQLSRTLTLTELGKVRPDLVAHACMVSPLVLAEYAREKLGGTLNGPDLPPLKTALTRTKPAKRYSYNPPPPVDLSVAWARAHGVALTAPKAAVFCAENTVLARAGRNPFDGSVPAPAVTTEFDIF